MISDTNIVHKIMMHYHNHRECAIKVCPMILSRDEMDELNNYCKQFIPDDEYKSGIDVSEFYGVKVVVIDE